METIIIIGAGASGMMAALTAAGVPGRRVILLERQQRAGRKLLATGNGRCNLTNTGATLDNYHGENRDFAAPALDGKLFHQSPLAHTVFGYDQHTVALGI